MSELNVVTLEDIKRARKDTPPMVFKTKRAGDRSAKLKEKLDELWWQNQLKEIDKDFVDYYDDEEF
jgi:hypothetical protein